MTGGDGAFDRLVDTAPTLFLVAGGLLVVFAVNTALEAFTGTFYPTVQDVVGPAGFFLGLLGLYGLYPAFAGRTPTAARGAAVVAAVPAVGWFLITVGGLAEFAEVISDSVAMVPVVFFFGVLVSTLLAYVAFGVVSFRAGVHSRTVSVLLFGPALTFLALISGAAPDFAVDAGHGLAHLGIGMTLWVEELATERAEPVRDSTA